jgi:MFS family permease
VAMAVGRFGGDALAERFGPVRLVRYGGVLAVVGMGLALLAAHPWLSLLGFIGVGAGFATVVPQIFTAAGNVRGISAGPALAAVTTMGYLGFLIGPPLIGFVAELFGLRNALGLVMLTSGVLVVCAGWVKPPGAVRAGVRAPERRAVREEAVLVGR